MALSILPVTGRDIVRYIPDLAELRIRVFCEWPYLYEGDLDHEREYLRIYSESPTSVVVLALDDGKVVGASTAVALTCEPEIMQNALRDGGFDPAKILYAGESLLYPEYRGHGVGLRFFDEREAHARRLGLTHVAFCRVIRAKDDPRRPVHAVDLDDYWRRRGYVLHPEIRTEFSWKETGGTEAVRNVMEFWIKRLCTVWRTEIGDLRSEMGAEEGDSRFVPPGFFRFLSRLISPISYLFRCTLPFPTC